MPFATARRVALAALLCAMLLALPALTSTPRAVAHGYIVRVIPASGSVLDRAPARIRAWFSEGLEPRFSSISLSDERGNPIPLTENGVLSDSPTQLAARIVDPLPDGAYVINLRVAFASDGHVFDERVIFYVGQQTGSLSGEGAARTADPVEVIWRAISLPALSVLFGSAVLYALVLFPAWRNARYKAGGIAPRILDRLARVAWIALAVALAGTLLGILQQSAALFATDLLTAFRDRLWQVILSGTQVGDTFRARLILLGIAAALLAAAGYFRGRAPFLVLPMWVTISFAGALVLGTISLSSHAAGADLWALLSVGVHWLHTLATGAWAGGLATLAIVLPVALAPLQGEARQAAQGAVFSRFAALGAVVLVLFVATGIYNTGIQVRGPADLWTTGYGLTLAAKLALVISALAIAAYHHALSSDDWLAGWLRSIWPGSRGPVLAQAVEGPAMRLGTLRLEVGLAVLVLIASGVLAATPPPVPPDAASPLAAPTQSVTLGDLELSLSIDPGGPGSNFYEASVHRSGQPVSGARVWLRLVFPALDRRTPPFVLDDSGEGVYAGAGAELDRAGEWQAQVDVLLPGEAPDAAHRFALGWTLPEKAPALRVREPSAFNWLGVGLIVLAFVAWWGPPSVRRVRRLELHRESALIGGALFVVTVIALVAGGVLIANSAAELDRLRYPPPTVVNPTLADAQSLAAGRAIYEAHCAECHGPAGELRDAAPGSPAALRVVVPTRRDESILKTLTEGHAEMPPAALTEAERWQVINYIRSAPFYAE
jgi:putative copper export protein/methionine-rich copper-binding protein CopC/mono/diheme cytochrome c family protein